MEHNPQQQVKSKDRVTDFGEVYTGEKEVKAMWDLIKKESYRIESKVLEPSCGNGNFLIESLRRKLETAKNEPPNSERDFGFLSLQAVSCLYGIDILEDNVKETRQRLRDEVVARYSEHQKDIPDTWIQSLDTLLEKNIIWGDTLICTQLGDNQPIVFHEWQISPSYHCQSLKAHKLIEQIPPKERPLYKPPTPPGKQLTFLL